MGDVMLFGILRMPYNMAMSNEISRHQYWQSGQQAADEIERLREALRLERQLRDAALALANDLQNELNRMNGHTWSVAAALQQKESD